MFYDRTRKGDIFSFMCMFCRSLFVFLYFFFWSLCCLLFFDLRILITSLWYLQTLCNRGDHLGRFSCMFYLENQISHKCFTHFILMQQNRQQFLCFSLKCYTKHILNQPFNMGDSFAADLLIVLVTASHICNKQNNKKNIEYVCYNSYYHCRYFYRNKQKPHRWRDGQRAYL